VSEFSTARRPVLFGLAAAGAVTLAACAPGSTNSSSSETTSSEPVSTDIASLGDITLTVWDQNTDEGINVAQEQLNEQFMAKYPNVTVERVARSFADLKTTLKLALSGDDAPDVVQANQGYPDMGAFVEAKLLQPADPWDELYGWTKNFPEDLLSLNSFSEDGKTWREGNLYGISSTGEIVGLFYNKALLQQAGVAAPTTMDEFVAALPVVKSAGLLPIQYGDADKSAGIHIFGALLAAVAGEKPSSDLVSSAGGSWTDPDVVSAATTLQEWATEIYLPDGHNGIGKDEAVARFAGGEGVFMFNGTWQQATLEDAMGTNVGFVALAGVDQKPETLGGVGLAWALTAKTANANAAAAYIDFVTNAAAAQVLVDTGNLPVVFPEGYQAEQGTLAGDIATSWDGVSQNGGLVPYLDYATPTFYDTLTAAVQQLTGGQADPAEFTETLQADYESFNQDR